MAKKGLNPLSNTVLHEQPGSELKGLRAPADVPQIQQLPRPEFDAVKVARLMQDMAAGRYQINPEVIADKLLAQLPSVVIDQATH